MDDKWVVGYEFSADKVHHDWDGDEKTDLDAPLPTFDRPTPRVQFLCTCGGGVGFTVDGALVPSKKPTVCIRERGGRWSYCATNDTITLGKWIWDSR